MTQSRPPSAAKRKLALSSPDGTPYVKLDHPEPHRTSGTSKARGPQQPWHTPTPGTLLCSSHQAGQGQLEMPLLAKLIPKAAAG